jgi:glycosyltransferase involved in cell wall biosynthesis
MKIALVTDAWTPQVNGVVRTWTEVIRRFEAWGHQVLVIHPRLFLTLPIPNYPEIRLSIFPHGKLERLLDEFKPDAIHVATEGTLGFAARSYCRERKLPFTTSYHTQYAHYLKIYYGVPARFTMRALKWFHKAGERTLVPTRSVGRELTAQGFDNTVVWSRGVDVETFFPRGKDGLDLPRPIFLTVGRVAPEKNIDAFLSLDLPGSKVVVGDGPARANLERRYPGVHWTGCQKGASLARLYSAADVFVFASRTDTFGITMLEANACGVPVAAFPVTGPIDVVQPNVTGVLDTDLRAACLEALKLNPQDCVDYANTCSWERCAQTAIDSFAWLRRPAPVLADDEITLALTK